MLHVKFVCGLIISGARRGATGVSSPTSMNTYGNTVRGTAAECRLL